MRGTLALTAKDLRVELRSKEMLGVMLLFSLLIILAFRFAFTDSVRAGTIDMAELSAASLWICFSFAAVTGIYATFEKERQRGTMEALMLCPVDRGTLFAGKALTNFLLVTVVNSFSLVMFSVFFDYGYSGAAVDLYLVMMAGTAAIVAIGTLVAAIVSATRSGAALFPIVSIPLVIFAVILPAVSATRFAIKGDTSAMLSQLQPVLGFAVLFAVVGYLLIDYVLEV
ncbi:MAG TPA: heme exporter protein CcmB [Methanomassiliicoccales archaeon]|jgi:heme exporter protein B